MLYIMNSPSLVGEPLARLFSVSLLSGVVVVGVLCECMRAWIGVPCVGADGCPGVGHLVSVSN